MENKVLVKEHSAQMAAGRGVSIEFKIVAAQLVEQLTVNQLVVGSSPTAAATFPLFNLRLVALWLYKPLPVGCLPFAGRDEVS